MSTPLTELAELTIDSCAQSIEKELKDTNTADKETSNKSVEKAYYHIIINHEIMKIASSFRFKCVLVHFYVLNKNMRAECINDFYVC